MAERRYRLTLKCATQSQAVYEVWSVDTVARLNAAGVPYKYRHGHGRTWLGAEIIADVTAAEGLALELLK